MTARRCLVGWILLALAFVLFSTDVRAGEPLEGKDNKVAFSGMLWARYSYLLEDPFENDSEKDDNAFAIDRVYLTFTSQLGERYTGRARIEMKNLNDGLSDILLKTADITIQEPFHLAGTKLTFGQNTGWLSVFYEEPWGYRVVSKTTTDRYLGISTTYIGATIDKKWAGGIVETEGLVANRTVFDQPVGANADPKYKTFGGRAYIRPVKEGAASGLGFGGYAQIAPKNSPSADNRTLWFGGHAFYEGKNGENPFTVGGQYDSRFVKATAGDGTAEVTSTVLSGIARVNLDSRTELFGRIDVVDFDTDHEDLAIDGPDFSSGTFNSRLAQNVIILGISRACSKSLRSIVDVSLRSFTDDIIVESPVPASQKVSLDNEVIVSVRLDAKL